MSISILIYGRNAHLLETRQWVLERGGYQVCSVTDLSAVSAALAVRQFDLLVLCHSLSQEECRRAVDSAAVRWPQIQYLVLTNGMRECHAEILTETFDIMGGPAKLTSRVNHMVHRKAKSILRHWRGIEAADASTRSYAVV